LALACQSPAARLWRRARKNGRVAVAIFGDGTANIGAFHEALNFAAIQKLPVIFVCENNLYGEYSRINLTTPVEDIAVRASSYHMPGIIVDGQDVDKVAGAMAGAVERARRGEGLSLVEMKTYRYRNNLWRAEVNCTQSRRMRTADAGRAAALVGRGALSRRFSSRIGRRAPF
jgi:pyruvate dehydrogenase E1 component alpha subunit